MKIVLACPSASVYDRTLPTHRFLRDPGFRLRPTGTTPFQNLRGLTVADLDALDLTRWDRKSYYDARCGLSPREFYRLITDPEGFRPDPGSNDVEETGRWAA